MKAVEDKINFGHYNCISLVLTTILNSEIDNYKTVWKQLGLMSYIDENDKLRIYPRYRSLKAELSIGNNIGLREFRCDSKEDFKFILKSLLGKYKVIVPVDTYYLNYCVNYENSHDFHFIEIKDILSDNDYLINDPMYRYSGAFLEESLYKSIIEGKKIESGKKVEEFSLWILDIEKYQEIDSDDFVKIVEENIKAMIGQSATDLYLDALPSSIPQHTGLSVFDDLIEIFEVKENLNERDYVENLYTDIKEISNSRYIYSLFLQSFLDRKINQVSVKEISELYSDIAHQWNVISNMILKFTISKNENLLPRILDKIKAVNMQEKKVVELQIVDK